MFEPSVECATTKFYKFVDYTGNDWMTYLYFLKQDILAHFIGKRFGSPNNGYSMEE